MNNFSDYKWGASQPNRDILKNEFHRAALNITTDNGEPLRNIKLQLYFEFDRKVIIWLLIVFRIQLELRKHLIQLINR
jgi:hypothetical protein